MFVLTRKAVAEFHPERAGEFVRYWSRFYQYDVKLLGKPGKRIIYDDELSISNGSLCDLTEENIRRLLRWKDPHMLTQEILSGRNKGKENDVVSKVLSRLRDINGFRRDEVTQEEMRRDVAERLFRSGIVFRAFLLHIAKPHIYPIADQHVFRAYALHTKKPPGWKSDNWEAYDGYRAYFSEIADAMGIERSAYNVRHLKEIDSALMVFGKFLKAYVPDSELT